MGMEEGAHTTSLADCHEGPPGSPCGPEVSASIGLGALFEVLQYVVQDCGVFNALGDDFHGAAALFASLDIKLENPFEGAGPGQDGAAQRGILAPFEGSLAMASWGHLLRESAIGDKHAVKTSELGAWPPTLREEWTRRGLKQFSGLLEGIGKRGRIQGSAR